MRYGNVEIKKQTQIFVTKKIDKFALTNAIYNMDAAYQKFFKEHAGYPKFKSKHDNHKSYTTNFTNGNIAVDFETGKIKLPKLKAAKAISDVSWYELTRQLEYKAKWNGRKYIKIDTFYASSQLCSVCGYQNPDTKDLSVRTWTCPKCGAEHDRDINAAKNILTEGLRQIA